MDVTKSSRKRTEMLLGVLFSVPQSRFGSNKKILSFIQIMGTDIFFCSLLYIKIIGTIL